MSAGVYIGKLFLSKMLGYSQNGLLLVCIFTNTTESALSVENKSHLLKGQRQLRPCSRLAGRITIESCRQMPSEN